MKKSKFGLIVKIMAIVSFVIAVFSCGYFSLDKVIIPRNFSIYGINGVKDLTNVFASLYGSPSESQLVVVGYDEQDFNSALAKLQGAGYKIEDDGTILQENIYSFKDDVNTSLILSSSEVASILESIIQSDILAQNLKNLNYIDTMNISILDFVILPDLDTYNETTLSYERADVKAIVKINTEELCEQISIQMQTSKSLLNVIIPNNLYFVVDYDIDLMTRDNHDATVSISVNGKSAEKSETLINLLISFIFPTEDEMTYDKFTSLIGSIALSGIDALGDFRFVDFDKENNQYGLMFS